MPWLEDYQRERVDDEDIIHEIGSRPKVAKATGKQKLGETWRGLQEGKGEEKQVAGGLPGEPNVQKQLPPLPVEPLPVKQQRSLLNRLRPGQPRGAAR